MNVGKNQNRMPIIMRVIPRSRSWRLSCCLGRCILLYIQRPRPICRYVCLSIVEKKELTIKITPRIMKKSASEKISIVYNLENREGGKPLMIRKHIILYSRVTAKTFPVKARSPWMAFIKSFDLSTMKHGCWLIGVAAYNSEDWIVCDVYLVRSERSSEDARATAFQQNLSTKNLFILG